MKNKLFVIVENLFVIILSGIGFYYFYGKLVDVHTNSCCEGISNCPIYMCSSNSPDLTKYSVYATIVVFCAILAILLMINLVSKILGNNK